MTRLPRAYPIRHAQFSCLADMLKSNFGTPVGGLRVCVECVGGVCVMADGLRVVVVMGVVSSAGRPRGGAPVPLPSTPHPNPETAPAPTPTSPAPLSLGPEIATRPIPSHACP